VFLALGPLVGGLLTEYVTWRAVFLLNVPVGLATLALVAAAKVENRPVAGARIAVRDAVLVVPGLALVTLGVGLVAWFVVRQLRSADPLIHLRLFADRGFTGDAVVMGLVQFGLLGIVLYSSIYLQELLGFGPMAAGLAALPLILPLTVAAQVGGRWFDRAGVRPPVLAGLVLCTLGIVAWLVALPALSYAWQIPGMLLVGVGLGLTLSPTNTDALGRVADAAQPGLGRGPDRPAGRRHPRRRRDRWRGALARPRTARAHRHRRVHRRGLRRRRGRLRHPGGRPPAQAYAFGPCDDPSVLASGTGVAVPRSSE
jgi:MFS family permease